MADPFATLEGGKNFNPFARLATAGLLGDVADFYDTGSYVLNAAVSGSLFGGWPSNTVTAIAGDPSTGKTYLCLQACGQFLTRFPEGLVFWFDSEFAVRTSQLQGKGIDPARFKVYPGPTIEDFRHQIIVILNALLEIPAEKRPRCFFVLDSLGNLSTRKEMEDMQEGEEKRDMTKPQLVKGAFRAITLKLGLVNCPLLVTNHVYVPIGVMYPTPEMPGGKGTYYCSSNIVLLGKSKDKAETEEGGKEVVGSLVRCKMHKSRFTREERQVITRIDFEVGLDRYHGLLELTTEQIPLFQKDGNRWDIAGNKGFEKAIAAEPQNFFTDKVLRELVEPQVAKYFKFGSDLESKEKQP